jgi:hypothetical protein
LAAPQQRDFAAPDELVDEGGNTRREGQEQ